jgi:archaellum component FlaC
MLRCMHGSMGSDIDEIREALRRIEQRITDVETRVEELALKYSSEGETLRRSVQMKTARTGEMSSRIAQRIAKLESAVEMLAREEGDSSDD